MGDSGVNAPYSVSVLLPSYRRGPHVKRTAMSWVQAWMAEGATAPNRLEIVIVDDGVGDGDAATAVDTAWLRELAASWRACGAEGSVGMHLAIRLVQVEHPHGKRSKSSVAALNHAAAVASGDVLVISNAESFVLFGEVSPTEAARARVGCGDFAPMVSMIGADPRLVDTEGAGQPGGLRPFRAIHGVHLHGGYALGACVNMGRGHGEVDASGAPRAVPPDVSQAHTAPDDVLRSVPARGMEHADQHAWRSHPSWRPTDLHWAGVMRREDFWRIGGFSARWDGFSTGWGEDGEFAWRARLWCDGFGEVAADRPFRLTTHLVVVHQWHPSAGGAEARDVAEGEALFDLARRDAVWAAADGGVGHGVAGAGFLRDRWLHPDLAFPGARVRSHYFGATGYDRTP